MKLRLEAIPFKQRRTHMYIAVMAIKDFQNLSVDLWNPKSPLGVRGYQRRPDEKRIKTIAKYFENKRSILPVAGLLNIRKDDAKRIKYKKGRLEIPDFVNIWVVDMQHRLRGLLQASDDGLLEEGFRFPVVITVGLSKIDEAAQFYLVNTKAKKMDVALTRRLLIENDAVKVLSDVKPWEIAAVRITIEVNKKLNGSNPWSNAIRQPNEDKQTNHIATEKSFVASLRQLLIAGKHKQPKRLAKRLVKYWTVIREQIPAAFDDPRHYLVQRTPGMFAFNFFIAPAILRLSDTLMEKKLEGLADLGPDFWKRSNKRGARRFGSGMSGCANLAEYVKKYIHIS